MSGETGAGAGWHDDEVVSAGLPDKRLARRFGRLLDQMSAALGQPLPAACGDWTATRRRIASSTTRALPSMGCWPAILPRPPCAARQEKDQFSFYRVPPNSSTAVQSRVRSASSSSSWHSREESAIASSASAYPTDRRRLRAGSDRWRPRGADKRKPNTGSLTRSILIVWSQPSPKS